MVDRRTKLVSQDLSQNVLSGFSQQLSPAAGSLRSNTAAVQGKENRLLCPQQLMDDSMLTFRMHNTQQC